MITDVGIDLDGVLYDFAGVFHDYAQERSGKELPPATKWDFYTEWGMSDAEFREWLYDATTNHNIFSIAAPSDDTLDAWDYLQQAEIKIHVLTHRHPEAYAQTIEWLHRYELTPDSLHFGENKEILNTISPRTSASLDDFYGYYQKYEKAGVLSFLCDQPWNREYPARRAFDFLDFVNKILLINEAEEARKVTAAPEPPKRTGITTLGFSTKNENFYIPKTALNPNVNPQITYWKNWF